MVVVIKVHHPSSKGVYELGDLTALQGVPTLMSALDLCEYPLSKG